MPAGLADADRRVSTERTVQAREWAWGGGGVGGRAMRLLCHSKAMQVLHQSKGRSAALLWWESFAPPEKWQWCVSTRTPTSSTWGRRPPTPCTCLTISLCLAHANAGRNSFQAAMDGMRDFQAPGRYYFLVAEPRLLCEAPEVALVGLKLLFASWAAQSDLLLWSLWKGFCMW